MTPETFLSSLIPNIDHSYQFKIKFKNSPNVIKSELHILYSDITEISIFSNKELINKIMVNLTHIGKICKFKEICNEYKEVIFIANRNRVLVEIKTST